MVSPDLLKSPYKIEFAVTTQSPVYDYVLLKSLKLRKQSGAVVSLLKNDWIKLKFNDEEYSVFALGKAYQAYLILPEEIEIDFENNKKVDVVVDLSLAYKKGQIDKEIVASFYAMHEKGNTLIFSTYTN